MPELSRFYGIVIYIFAMDHNPPHFHAKYNEFVGVIAINTGQIIKGELPKRAQRLIEKWRQKHYRELMENWYQGQTESPDFKKIKPLD